jgi:hypothetical protein
MRFASLFAAGLLAVSTAAPVPAVELAEYLPAGVQYDPAIPTPSSVLGYEVGEWHVRHDQLVQYMYTLARACDRMQIEETGRTYEQRPLLLLTISSPANLARLDSIRRDHVANTRPGSDSTPLEQQPLILYMGYSVHGNESSGSNAALLVAYHLAAARGIDELLDHAVILLDPSLNPDGLARFAHWANMHRGKNLVADPLHREHMESWPSGRTNHYWFDLNRDWLPLQHPESRARIRTFHRWKPNVLTDFHEMESNATFFFQPGVASRRHPMTPEANVDLTRKLAAYHARALDEKRLLYYSEERFDDFYYGKGSTYPDVNGCIGILFEQASSRGHRRESIHGVFDFPFTIRNQFITSLSTLRGALENRVELLTYQREFYEQASDLARNDPVKGYVFGDDRDLARTHHLLEILQLHQVEVYELARRVEQDGVRFEPGHAYVVPHQQPQYRLVKALFETRESFADSLFYDVSTWTLPLAMGLPYTELRRASDDILGTRVDTTSLPQGQAPMGPAPYAYAFSWHHYYAPRALHRLLQSDVRARVVTRPFKAQTRNGLIDLDYGSVVVPLGIQEASAGEIEKLIREIARSDAVNVHALDTGLTPEGVDIGSPSLRPLELPKPLLVVGRGVSSNEAGGIWHLLDQRFDIELSMVDVENLNRVDFDDYSHVLLVNGSYDALDQRRVDELKRWVRAGGILVATKGAVQWVDEKELVDLDFRSDVAPETAADSARFPYAEHQRRQGAQIVSGAIFATEIDVTHPLAYGYRRPLLPVFRNHRIFLEPAKNPYGTVAQYTQDPLLSGYISTPNLRKLRGSAAVVAERVGSGAVLLLLDDPNFRAFWYGTNKLLMNALFFGSVIRRTQE